MFGDTWDCGGFYGSLYFDFSGIRNVDKISAYNKVKLKRLFEVKIVFGDGMGKKVQNQVSE